MDQGSWPRREIRVWRHFAAADAWPGMNRFHSLSSFGEGGEQPLSLSVNPGEWQETGIPFLPRPCSMHSESPALQNCKSATGLVGAIPTSPSERYAMKIMKIVIACLRIGAGLSLMGMVVLTCADVVGGLFDEPVLGSEEIVGLMGALVLAFGLPLTHHEKGHIGVDLLYRIFPDAMKRVVDIGISLVTSVFFGLLAWQSYLYAAEMKKVGLVSATIQFPVHYVIYGVCFGCFVLTIMIFAELIEGLKGETNE